jgi:hypothetical protein
MKEDELKKLVEYYEERILTKFDYHFNKLVLEDFYEGGYEMRIEDEWFYDEYFDKYEDGIINLLKEIEDDEYHNYKLRLIKLKRTIDNHLTKLNKEPNSTPIRQSRISYFILLSNIDKNKFTDLLHSKLTSHNYIECTLDNFIQLFQKNTEIDKVKWKGNELQITYLFNHLIKYMDKEVNNSKYKLIQTYFNNKSGNNFKAKQIGSVYAEKKDIFPSDDPILMVLKEMSTQF